MAQRERYDEPGALHHVVNRGLAKRPVFEQREHVRKFLAELARAVRVGWIEVLAYVVLTTHFHLLVRSPRGEMWRGMRRAENVFVRWFNRRHRRDGPLFRGRFWSKRVWSDTYLRTLLRYIDHNPVEAGLVTAPGEYPHGSAVSYLTRERGPPWLSRSLLEGLSEQAAAVRRTAGSNAYAAAFGDPLSPAEAAIVTRRMRSPTREPDPLDDLLNAATPGVLEWMRRKARLADGTRPGTALVSPETLAPLLQDHDSDGEASSQCRDDPILRAGLLRDVCGLTNREIALLCRVAESTASARARRHRTRLVIDAPYAERAAATVAAALRQQWQPDWIDRV